jgi:hypothetical protein
LRSSLKKRSDHHSPSPRRDFNPFLASARPPTSTIPAFFNNQSGGGSGNTGGGGNYSSIFDRETQKYLHEESPQQRTGFKLPYGDRGPDMQIAPVHSRSRLFSPNPLDQPNLLDPVIGNEREKNRKSPSRHSHNSRSHRNHHRRHSRSRHSRSRHSRSRRSKNRHSRSRSSNEDDEITRQEKRKYLLDLEKLRLQGVRLTKDYSMNDPIADIRFEYDSHRSNYDVVDSINFMKDILGFSFTLVESLNQRFGPFLQLNGWSAYMKKNMNRFDRLLERAYHRFWRQGQPSPFMEFGMLVFGSMIMWHLQNKYLNGLPVGEMLGVMGGGQTPQTPQQPLAAASGNSNNANAGGFSLGNIMRMFTGGTANRPSPPQASASSAPPTIIPPVPSGPLLSGQTRPLSSQSSQQQQRQEQQRQQQQRQEQRQQQQQQSATGGVPVSGNNNNINGTQRTAVPPSGTAPTLPGLAATLPPMNVRGITSPPSNSNAIPSTQPVRRMLRRPSAHLRDSNVPPRPLSPISESTHEHEIPSPP